MPLDLHVAKNAKVAPYINPCASFELQPHELIFYRIGLPKGKFPLFERMKNYYGDTSYNPGDLKALIAEVKEIMSLFSENNQLVEQLNNILIACEIANRDKLSIWVFCD
jgi:hypothetical protein